MFANRPGLNLETTLSLLTVFAVFSCLYPPQVLLPTFSERFGAQPAQVALLISLSMVSLILFPPLFGLLSQSLGCELLSTVSVIVLGIAQILFPFAPWFEGMLLLRIIQGICFACAITCLMTLISAGAAPAMMQSVMKYYVSATIVGGFLGRWATGVSVDLFGEASFFLFSGTLCLVLTAVRLFLPARPKLKTAKPRLVEIPPVFFKPENLITYLMIFCCFFAFGAMLNYLPFRIRELDPLATETTIGMLYVGYLCGIITSLYAPRIQSVLRSQAANLLLSMAVYAISTLIFSTEEFLVIILLVGFFCGAFFLIHTTLVTNLNQSNTQFRGTVNGLYVSLYYAGGSLGAFFPGVIYGEYGWSPFLWLIFAVQIAALILLLTGVLTKRAFCKQNH